MAHWEDGIFHVDPETLDIVATIPATAMKVYSDGLALWAIDENVTFITKIDPNRDRVVATLDLGGQTPIIGTGIAGELWVATMPDGLFLVDGRTTAVERGVPAAHGDGVRRRGLRVRVVPLFERSEVWRVAL